MYQTRMVSTNLKTEQQLNRVQYKYYWHTTENIKLENLYKVTTNTEYRGLKSRLDESYFQKLFKTVILVAKKKLIYIHSVFNVPHLYGVNFSPIYYTFSISNTQRWLSGSMGIIEQNGLRISYHNDTTEIQTTHRNDNILNTEIYYVTTDSIREIRLFFEFNIRLYCIDSNFWFVFCYFWFKFKFYE